MPWINPLDRLPQVPVDYANHIIYGGFGGFFLLFFVDSFDAILIMLGISAIKKIADYFLEQESLSMCVGKTFITALWPLSIWLSEQF